MAWLYQRPDSGRWWIGFRQNGVQILKSTGTTDKAEAERFLARTEMMLTAQRVNSLTVEVFQAISGKELPTATLKSALDEWLKEAGGATGPRTVEKYKALSDELKAYFHATDKGPLVSDVTREQLQDFLNKRRALVSASTANMARKCLAVFLRRCKANGKVRDNPMDGIRPFKATRGEKRVRRPFTVSELGAIYQHAPDDFWRYMILGGFFTGLRLGDLVCMPIGAVDFGKRQINLLTRKTQASMHIPIAAPFLKVLAKLKADRPGSKASDLFWPEQAQRYEKHGSGWLSQKFYDLLLVKAGLAGVRPHRSKGKTRSDKRRVNEVSFHCFRHSFVSFLAATGQNQQVVKALAGHSSDEINDLYTKVPGDVLTEAVSLLPNITASPAIQQTH